MAVVPLGCATLMTLVPTRVVALAAVLGVIAIVWAIVRWRTPSAAERRSHALRQDAKDPRKAWTQAAFGVVCGEIDYGHLPRSEARQMLIHWWEVHGPRELGETLRDLEEPGRPDNAWDLLRFIVVARLGVAAQYVAADEAWDRIFVVAERLQRAYPSWPAMAQAYVVARRQWKGIATDGSADDDGMRRILDNIARLRDARWRQIPWLMPLDPATREPDR